jgi:hypothetical protein
MIIMMKKFKSLLIILTMIFTVLSPAAVMANNQEPVIKDVTICEKLGHDLIVITIRPTCEDVGRIATTCLRCDYEDMIIIAALGHDLINEVIIEPTCERYGSITANCSCCDYEEETIFLKLEHYFKSKITVPPTFETEGVKTHTCIHCNESYTTVIPKLDPAIK